MISMNRAGSAAAAVLLALALAAGAGSQTAESLPAKDLPAENLTAENLTTDAATASRALASNGAVVVMPEIAGLDCAQMARVLRRIDLSGYRGAEPVPEDHPDWPIFAYEDRLTRLYYRSCTLGEDRLKDPGAAFSAGFETE